MTSHDDMKASAAVVNVCGNPIDESDTESFHSAISFATRHSSRQTMPEEKHQDAPASPEPLIAMETSNKKEAPSETDVPTQTQPRPRPRSRATTACSHRSNTSTTSTIKPSSSQTFSSSELKPHRSKRSRHNSVCSSSPSNPSIPRRQSSLSVQQQDRPYHHNRRRRSRKDSATLHSQSCQIFSSLDGMLAMGLSPDITPLPSVSTSTSTTRHASLVPSSSPDPESIRRVCEKIDARLASAAAASRKREEDPCDSPYGNSSSYSALPSPTTAAHSPALRTSASFDPHTISDRTSLLSSQRRRDTFTLPPTSAPIFTSNGTTNPLEAAGPRPPLNTVISWTSAASRRAEYAKIDRANSGVRGFMKRAWPLRCLRSSHGDRRGFFTGECDGDSVRRFRIDDAESESETREEDESEDDEDGQGVEGMGHLELDEKMAMLRVEQRMPSEGKRAAKGATTTATHAEKGDKEKQKERKPWWSCFDL